MSPPASYYDGARKRQSPRKNPQSPQAQRAAARSAQKAATSGNAASDAKASSRKERPKGIALFNPVETWVH